MKHELHVIRDEDLQAVLADLHDLYGYDFSDYAKASLKRRINRLITIDGFPSFAEFRYRIISDETYLQRVVEELTVNVTEMFRDPGFYRALKSEVLPILATYPLIRIWHAGCSTGEEVYSMAIMLKEANLLQKSLLYATDINPQVLERARSGIMYLGQMKQYSANYQEAGGEESFSNYYTANYDRARLDESLINRVIFSTHNLVSDRSFNEFQLILCRNVLIYFDKILQERVLTLFDSSLEKLGFLALGTKETIRFSGLSSRYRLLNDKEKIWRKMV